MPELAHFHRQGTADVGQTAGLGKRDGFAGGKEDVHAVCLLSHPWSFLGDCRVSVLWRPGKGRISRLILPSRPGPLFAALPVNSSVIKVSNGDKKMKLRKELRSLAVQVHHSSPRFTISSKSEIRGHWVSLSRRLPAQTAVGRAVPTDRVA